MIAANRILLIHSDTIVIFQAVDNNQADRRAGVLVDVELVWLYSLLYGSS